MAQLRRGIGQCSAALICNGFGLQGFGLLSYGKVWL